MMTTPRTADEERLMDERYTTTNAANDNITLDMEETGRAQMKKGPQTNRHAAVHSAPFGVEAEGQS